MASRALMAIGIKNCLAKYSPLTTKKIKIMTKTLLESVGEELYIGQLLVIFLK
jgi:hypothetical protein